jgi:hypothetical protein
MTTTTLRDEVPTGLKANYHLTDNLPVGQKRCLRQFPRGRDSGRQSALLRKFTANASS